MNIDIQPLTNNGWEVGSNQGAILLTKISLTYNSAGAWIGSCFHIKQWNVINILISDINDEFR